MVIIDVYSKYSIVEKLKYKNADTVCEHLKKIFYQFGPPAILQSDNGKEFRNSSMERLCEEFKVIKKFSRTRPRHPQSQGQVERLNQTLTRSIQKNIYKNNNNRWIDILDKIVYIYNTTIHAATKKSLFKLYFLRIGYNTVNIKEEETDWESDNRERSN
ncbi:putative uncharacterized transposon-derived protein F54H12.3 [Dictyocoela muelleri]|nr:putative uncharacterized transposon-derived protein F54H12.3 [Dictyocoela muelleri]